MLTVLVGTLFGVHMASPDKALDLAVFREALPDSVEPVTADNTLDISAEGYQKIAENEAYTLELDAATVSLRVTHKATGVVWYSGYPLEEYGETVIPKDRRTMRTLCSVSYTDFDSVEETISNAADEVTTAFSALKNGVEIELTFPEQQITLSMQFYLDDTGFRVRIPKDKIREQGAFGIVQIDVMPAFGSVKSGDDGYIFYPDGCGTLYDCKVGTGYGQIHTQDIYGSHVMNFDETEMQSDNGQKSILLPCFGSASARRGFLAYMEEGSEYSSLSFSPSSSFFKLNRVYATAVYRRMMVRTTPDKKEIYVTEKVPQTEDICINYLLLVDQQANYSGMACALRSYMQKSGRLPVNTVNSGEIPLALEILLGTKEDNLYGKTGLAMTTYRQALAMLQELSANGVDSTRTILLGWQKEGYGQYPLSSNSAGFLGSAGDLKKLLAFQKETNCILLQNDYVQAEEGGRFSKQSDVVQSFLNMPITNALKTRFLLNPFAQYKRFVNTDGKAYQKLGAVGLAFDSISDWLPSDSGKSRKLTATDAKYIYASMARQSKNNGLMTAVQKGSDYLLPYADYVYNAYDGDSHLFAFSKEIPFYQMVIHGVVPYSCSMPGNMSSDFTYQKLKWVEYGSLPYFIVSEKPSNDLRDTGIDDIFSSRFTDWKDTIVKTYQEFKEKLSPIANEVMVSHEYLQSQLVCVTYESGQKVYINYADKAAQADGREIPAMDYIVVNP